MAVVIVREIGSDEWVVERVERVDDGLYILLMLTACSWCCNCLL